MKLKSITENNNLDPRLQVTLDRFARRTIQPTLGADSRGEIAVVAVVKEPKFWEDRTDFRIVADLGKTRDGANHIVTARVPVSRVADLRKDPRVVSLKGAQQMGPALSRTVPDILATPAGLPSGTKLGEGAVVGIIDYGCDFAHLNFRMPDGTGRVEAIWDQAGILQPQSDVQYGRVYKKAAIDAALHTPDPYATLGYDPDPTLTGSHGTHVMDIAAGHGGGSGVPGVAPNAAILFVHLSTDDIPWSGEASVTTKLGDSVHLLEALAWIFQTAGDRPCVVNVSLGTNGGPHDGSTPFEHALDALVSSAQNRAVVIAAANAFADHIHAKGAVAQDGFIDLTWSIPITGAGPNEMEIWYSGKDEIAIELLDETGNSFGTVELGNSARVNNDAGQTLVFVINRKTDPMNGDNVIGIYLEGTVSQRTWTVRLHGRSIKGSGEFHAWIERNDRSQSFFTGPSVDDSYTLGSLSCGYESIVVTSYDAHYNSFPISWFSSSGPTRDGRSKPEVSAPGQEVIAARSRTLRDVINMSGTSMAAPAVTGAVAIMLAEARAVGLSMTSADIRQAVVDSARRNPPPNGGGWNARYGTGRINVSHMVNGIRQPAGPANSPPPPPGQGPTAASAGPGPGHPPEQARRAAPKAAKPRSKTSAVQGRTHRDTVAPGKTMERSKADNRRARAKSKNPVGSGRKTR